MSEEKSAATQQESKLAYKWDIFLAHPGLDSGAAKNLFNKLNPPAKVFLDKECLSPGDEWDLKLSEAQRSSLISVILVTPNTEAADYQKEEIATALAMKRFDPRTHRVVPVYLNSKQIPYGLRRIEGLHVPETGDLTETVNKLLKILNEMKQLEVKKDEFVVQTQIGVAKITDNNSSRAEVLAGLVEVTKSIHPNLILLFVLFVFIIAALIICINLMPDSLHLLLSVFLLSFATLVLFSMLCCMAWSVGNSRQIAQGRINGG